MEEALIKRVLPHSVEAEQSVIGSMIMDRDAIMTASEVITSEDFYQSQYGVLFDAMLELYNEGKPVDLVTLQERLREKDVPPEISSLEFVRDLLDAVPTSANVRHYATIVQEKSMLRKLIKVNEDIANTCYLAREKTEDILEETEKKIFDLLQYRSTGDFVPIKQVVLNALDKIEKASKNKGTVTGIPTGFIDLDYKTSGFQPSDLILIAARPGMGKTAIALNICLNVAKTYEKTVAFFSLEMSREQLVMRLLSTESFVENQKLTTGHLEDDDWSKLSIASSALSQTDIRVDDNPAITVAEINAKCRRLDNLGLVLIDYLQLMTAAAPGKSGDNRVTIVSDISRALKIMAKELNVPVICLSQLSRANESRTDKRPMLSDLRESGAIEQDADSVLFLYRDEYYNPNTQDKNIAECIIAKNRHGETGTVKLQWRPQFFTFSDLEWKHEG